ncbi:MAG: CocE/NonD family hydrolase [Acidimicrobiales bacterium]
MADFVTDDRDGMRIDWDVPIEMDDGEVMRADIYRPPDDRQHPVILSYGPYAKGLPFQTGYVSAWERMATKHPDVTANSTNKYQNWEVVDPEKWVPYGYVCVRVDSRGTGRSPGYIDHFSPRETKDFYDCIEWSGVQSWSNGRVGLNGISYYGINQWHVASLQPPHLAAMCVWEGAADWYRDMTHHGGILCTFWENWYDMQVKTVQYGSSGGKNPNTGVPINGDEVLSDEDLAANRCDFGAEIASHPMNDQYHKDRSPLWDRITAPLLTASNWGGQGLHPRGNFEGYTRVASQNRWLEAHGIEHWTEFYTDYGRELQLRFFDHFLKGEDNGWDQHPRVQLLVRHPGERFVLRHEDDWPIPRTQWTEMHLHPDGTLSTDPSAAAATVSFEAMGEGLKFRTAPLLEPTEFTGPLAAKLWVSSSTSDADLFLIFRVFDPDNNEVTFQGALDPHTPIAQGWLRASHRQLDPELSRPYRPYHTHSRREMLAADDVVELDVELWPTSIVVPAGYTVELWVRGSDYHYEGELEETGLSNMKNPFTGVGPFLHDDVRSRPPEIFSGTTTLHLGPDRPSYVLAPIISD